MSQSQLPIFPKGSTLITPQLAFTNENEQITYTYGTLPVFSHAIDDHKTFRMITAQFCVSGNAKQADVVRAFGVTNISVKRAVKLYREKGPAGFYEKRKTRGAAVLTESVLIQAQQMLDEGKTVSDVASALEIKSNTLAKAVVAGRLHKPIKKKSKIQ